MMSEVSALTISTDVFDSIFPFHIAIDGSMRIRHVGKILHRIYPSLKTSELLLNFFAVKDPIGIDSFELIATNLDSLFVLTSRQSDLILRGQIVFSRKRDLLVYLCSPWMGNPDVIRQLGLTVSDFALHDPVVDLLHVLQSQAISVSDLKRLTKTLEQKGAALVQANQRLEQQFTELERIQALTKTILDTAPDGIMTIDAKGTIEMANRAAERLFGYQPTALIGRSVNDLMRPEDAAQHDSFLTRYLETRQPQIFGTGRAVIGRRLDGSLIPLYLSVGESSAGNQIRFSGILHDISEQKNAESALRIRIDEMVNRQPHPMFHGRKVLLVEERSRSCEIFRNHADRLGIEVQSAASLEAMPTSLGGAEFDAIVLAMPPALDLNREDVNTWLRRQPVVVCGLMRSREAAGRLEIPHAGWLTKPIKAAQFDQLFLHLFGSKEMKMDKLPSSHEDEPANVRNIRILVAEDNPINQKVALKMISNLGYRADVVRNGYEVLDALERQNLTLF